MDVLKSFEVGGILRLLGSCTQIEIKKSTKIGIREGKEEQEKKAMMK